MDNAENEPEAREWISKLRGFLDLSYDLKNDGALQRKISSFPSHCRSALRLLPTRYLSPQPLYDLLKGFEMDLDFSTKEFPIKDQNALQKYGARVAGTVAELIIELVYYHSKEKVADDLKRQILDAGNTMGIALQIVNIARDIEVDAAIGRVYIPTTWLKECGLAAQDVIHDPGRSEVLNLRLRLLDYAMQLYAAAKPKIEMLPPEARRPMRVAVESYMEIGRVLQQPKYQVKAGRATVPKLRRIRVAWQALCT